MRILRLKIDVTKIDETKLFKGKKGTYLDATVFLEEEKGQYGDNGMIVQDLGKEARERGEKGAILGNATYPDSRPAQNTNPDPGDAYRKSAGETQQPKQLHHSEVETGEGDDIPF